MNKKKAMSPTTSTILLIVLTVIIALIIILWLFGFFSESILKFNSAIDKSCNEAKFKVSFVKAEGSGFPEIQIANIGSIQIFDFSLRYIQSDGKANVESLGRPLESGNSISIEMLTSTTIETTKIQVFPVLLGQTKSKNKQKVCLDNMQEIILKPIS